MTLKRSLTALLSCFVVGGAFAQTMPKEINIAYVKAPFNLQNIVMKEQGLLEKAFEKYGTEIKWHTITSGAKQAQAMAAGSLDFSAVMNTASLLSTNGAGNRVLIANGVAHPAETFAIVGQAGKALSVKDLKGKKIAGPRGTVLHQLLIAALLKEGLSINDVQFVSMDQPAALSALLSGQIDAALLAASGIIKAQEAGAQVITTAKDLLKVNLVLTVREKFAKEHPKALEEVVKVQRQALAWIKANRQKAIELGAKEHGIGIKEAQQLADWSHYYDRIQPEDIEGLKEDQVFLIENKMMQKAVDVESLVLPLAKK